MLAWTLHDPEANETWVFPRNPNTMTSPFAPKNTQFFPRRPAAAQWVATSRVLQYRRQPFEWSFGGSIRTEAHWAELKRWCRKSSRLIVTDHLNRSWEIRILSPEFEERQQTARLTHRYRYTVKAIIYGQVTTP